MESVENDLISIVTHKEISALYKTFLEQIDELAAQNTISQETRDKLRKKILDSGNTCERNLVSFLSFFDFVINKEKVAEAAKQRRVVKKIIISSATEVI